ncbi:MAG: crispr-associated protein Csh2 family [Bacteroidota bacterium]
MTEIKNRSELLFLYDVKRCNPNGDPLDSNRPRIDENSGKCLVTDVRLKRTIRDYLYNKGYDGNGNKGDIFIRDEDGMPVTGKKRAESYKDKNDFIQKFIDVRLFGGVSAPGDKEKTDKDKADKGEKSTGKSKVFHYTGPVQFSMGSSLHPVKENFIKGTGAFATKEGAAQRTFREEYNITYGLIGFHGVVNENAAKHVHTTENDVKELLSGLWDGTKDLLTRSKKGHQPRLLVKIDYISGFFIGDLCERLTLVPKAGYKPDSLEDVSNYQLDTAALNQVLAKYDAKIISITIEQDERLELTQPIRTK